MPTISYCVRHTQYCVDYTQKLDLRQPGAFFDYAFFDCVHLDWWRKEGYRVT